MSLALLLAMIAAPPDLELSWRAPPGCPVQAEVELRIADLVGRSVTVGPGASWAVDVQVRAEAESYAADVQLRTSLGEEARPLRARACDALADAVAVIIALALDSATPPPPEPPPPATATATVARAPPRPRVVRPRPRRRPLKWSSPLGLHARLEGLAHFGLPDPGVGVAASVGLQRAGWSFAMGAVLRRSGLEPVEAGLEARVEVVAGLLRGCAPLWRARPWGLDGCGLVELGRAEVSASGRAEGARGLWWAHAGPELQVSFEARGSWRGFLAVHGLVAVARPEALIETLNEGDLRAFRAPPVSLGVAIGARRDFFLTD